jgi:hypothetical protein
VGVYFTFEYLVTNFTLRISTISILALVTNKMEQIVPVHILEIPVCHLTSWLSVGIRKVASVELLIKLLPDLPQNNLKIPISGSLHYL